MQRIDLRSAFANMLTCSGTLSRSLPVTSRTSPDWFEDTNSFETTAAIKWLTTY
jgi:hypothetical protein